MALLDAPVQACNHNYMTTDQGKPADKGTGKADKGTDKATETDEKLRGWFTGRLPADWFTAAPEIVVDREEITLVGTLGDPAADGTDAERAEAVDGRVRRFRAETREQRIQIAREAEHRYGRKVSWGVACGGRTVMFTTLSVPVMTRLRQPQRLVLDALVDAGVARRRRGAPAWGGGLVGGDQDHLLPA